MVYITGDTHGDAGRFSSPAAKAIKGGDTIIVCGDFGFLWSGSKKEARTLKKLEKKDYTICFVDGTHENFKLLNEYEVTEWNGGKVHRIGKNIFHLMRGQVFTVEGIKIFTMGGGESPDIDFRLSAGNWSKDEIPRKSELIEGAENLQKNDFKVDIIVTHEPPAQLKRFMETNEDRHSRISGVNAYLEELNTSCTFSKWYFGSFHQDKYISSNHTALFSHIVECKTGKQLRGK